MASARTDLTGVDEIWRKLSEGVEAQDTDARLQTRQLVADTFERIVIYHKGMRPAETPIGMMNMMLVAQGGTARLLRINAQGLLVAAESLAGEG